MVPATDAYAIPESLTFQQAAGLAFDYITAYLTLHRHANLQKGQSVLIHRAGGGIVSHVPTRKYAGTLCLRVSCFRDSLRRS